MLGNSVTTKISFTHCFADIQAEGAVANEKIYSSLRKLLQSISSRWLPRYFIDCSCADKILPQPKVKSTNLLKYAHTHTHRCPRSLILHAIHNSPEHHVWCNLRILPHIAILTFKQSLQPQQ